MHKVLVSICINDSAYPLKWKKSRKMHYAFLLHTYQSHYRHLRINSTLEKEAEWRFHDGKAASELCDTRNDGAMRHNKILDLVSGVSCALLHGRPAIDHYADSIMPILLPVTPKRRVTDDARWFFATMP